jgi:hypothetical protein
MRNVIEFTHRASGARECEPLARPIARARRAMKFCANGCILPHDEPGAPAGMLMSLMAPDLLSTGSA